MKPTAPSDLELSQAVLDALREPAFLIDGRSATIRPMNAAAAKWMAELHPGATGEPVEVSQIFPELAGRKLCKNGPEELSSCAAGSGAQRREVKLSLAPVGPKDVQLVALLVMPAEPHRPDDSAAPLVPVDAFHDALTHLPNRRLFDRRLRRAIDKTASGNYLFAVLFVDLDRFKEVNDQFGHLQGDRVLVEAAQRLAEAVRPQDMIARRDGDEFLILLDDLSHEEDAVGVAHRIIEHLQQPLPVDTAGETTGVSVGASVGIATSGDAAAVEELIARADSAMYQAKALGGNTYIMSRHPGGHRTGKPLPR